MNPAITHMTLTHEDFEYIRGLIHREAAISLDDGKRYLAETRLHALAQREGLNSVGELMVKLRVDQRHSLQDKVVEAMTTNETSFFRDIHPFEAIRKSLIPDLMNRRTGIRRLRFWCAASSSGQEPYSVAMLVREHFPELITWNVEIIASDLSTAMLTRAREGRYSQLEVNRGVPAPLLIRHFRRSGLDWFIDESLKRMVDLRMINLIQPWPFLPVMDIVIIRNVLIYFDEETKRQVLTKVANLMAPDGYMILGAPETPLFANNLFERFSSDSNGIFRLRRPER